MTRILLKRVYEPALAGDGYRVLVDRLWPRGVRKDKLHDDLWAKQIAPSVQLRRWYHADAETRWPMFRIRYTEELRDSEAVRAFLTTIGPKKVVTLLYAAKDSGQNHARVLQDYLQYALSRVTVS